MSTPVSSSARQAYETKYKNSRANLIFVVVFTVINMVLLITQSDTYFLFSAFIPYALVAFGMSICGMYPAEYYGEEFADMSFFSPSVFTVLLVIAVMITLLYFLCWIFSKNNRKGWLIAALVIFSFDTLGMFLINGFALDSIIDIVFHIWVVVSLCLGISACQKLKQMPAEEGEVVEAEQTVQEECPVNSNVIRLADPHVKARVLLEGNAFAHSVVYRRVKRVNELVIDGNVYDEIEALAEFAHELKAEIDGHSIAVGYDGFAHSYLKVDGEITMKKLRLI